MSRNMTGDGFNLVNWPTSDDQRLRDSREGGLYAFAVWPFRDSWSNCFVEELIDIHMADVQVSAHGPMAETLNEMLDEWSDGALTDWTAAAPISRTVGASLFLGSTGESLFSDAEGEYFNVTAETLTGEGRALIAAMEAVYGPATFVTFLDT